MCSQTSRSAALSAPVTSPITPGRNGSRFLRTGSNSPSACSLRLSCSSWTSSRPSPAIRSSAHSNDRLASFDQTRGVRQASTVMPSVRGPAASRTVELQVSFAEWSLRESRRVRNWVGAVRRRNSITWPCTQIQPQRSTQPLTWSTTALSGCGFSGELRAVLGGPAGISAAGPGCHADAAAAATRRSAIPQPASPRLPGDSPTRPDASGRLRPGTPAPRHPR